MTLNVDALLIVSGMIFVTCMGGLGALWVSVRRLDRDHERAMERLRR